MTSLVTGTTGAIGAHIAKRLLDRGERVIGIAHDKHPKGCSAPELLGVQDKIYWAHGDIVDQTFVKRVTSDYEVSTIYHIAALPIVRVGNISPVAIWKVNVEGTWNLMEAARESGASVYFMSTDKVYGHHGNVPYEEDFALNGLNVYECSKACADRIVQSYHYVYGLKTVVARPCNIYGPADLNSRLIPNSIRNCLRGDSPVIYAGIGYTREWIYIDDVVDAIVLLTENFDKTDGQVFNVGSGFQATQEEVVQHILKYFPGQKPRLDRPEPYMRIETPYQTLSSDKIRKHFGWRPRVTFEEGISRTVRWWKDNIEMLGVTDPKLRVPLPSTIS
jgi:CDP-glucose 4,6-dehydratase